MDATNVKHALVQALFRDIINELQRMDAANEHRREMAEVTKMRLDTIIKALSEMKDAALR